MPLDPHTRLGPYEIQSLLGEGGMGEVYRARDTRLGRAVAIKVINKHLSGRFEREARAISALNHPNICTLYDVGPNYLVMELVEGETLAARVRRGPLSAPDVLRFAMQIAEALDEAHTMGMVHRDLKPANVMITPVGRVKVLDFGLAKMLEESDPETTKTVDGAVLGTFAYMAPEQLQGKPADPRSDIFAFGAVLYEMLSGQRAFATPVSREEPATLMGVPSDLSRVARRCLHQDPADRYPRMADVRAALERCGTASHAPAAEPEPSIAVLPFANMSGDKENEYFSDGLAEEILNALTRVSGLKVTARTSAFAFRGEKQDIRKIGDALDVRTVLEGSVRKAGNRVRITAQLINVANGYRLWSERYDRELTDVFAIQDEISQAIVDTLKVHLVQPSSSGKAEGRPAAMGQQTNVEAYQAYLKGRFHYFKMNPEGAARGKASVEEAIALDPNYAPAYVLLARCYLGIASYGMSSSVEMAALAKTAVLKALELNEIDAGAHAVLASLAGPYEYNWKEALRQCQIALTCGPISSEDRFTCAAAILSNLRRFDEAIAVVQPAVTADPLAPLPRVALALALASKGSYERAIQELQRVLEMQEDLWLPYAGLGLIYTGQGKNKEAIAVLEKCVQLFPWNAPLVGLLAGNYARAGDRARADRVLASLDASGRDLFRALGYAAYYILCADWDRAAENFEKGMEARHPFTVSIAGSPIFDDFRKTPQGRALLVKMNMADIA